jgi:hypothetical protein
VAERTERARRRHRPRLDGVGGDILFIEATKMKARASMR